MTARVNFDEAPPPGHINFGIGQPSADMLPVELLRRAADRFLAQAHPLELNYGIKQGDLRFREALTGLLRRADDAAVHADSLLVTSGNSQALDFVCSQFTRPGDMVFVEEPSYFLAFQLFRDHGLEIVSIPMDEDGMDLNCLESELAHHKPAFVYTIPSFQNPGGQTLSAERRVRLVELSQQHQFLILADEVYQLLYYYDAPPPSFGSMAQQQADEDPERGSILSLGSFSKILAPALRLGWIQTAPNLMRRLLENASLSSSGSLNHFTSHIVGQAIESGMQETHLEFLRTNYRARVEAMDAALKSQLGAMAQWRKPQGGYFFWLEFDPVLDARKLRKRTADFKTGFQPGTVFSNRGDFSHCLRLSFAHYDEADIVTGIERLAALLRA